MQGKHPLLINMSRCLAVHINRSSISKKGSTAVSPLIFAANRMRALEGLL